MIESRECFHNARTALATMIFPPKCCNCGEFIDINAEGAPALCDACRKEWDDEKERSCDVCNRPAVLCKCCTVLNKSSLVHSYSSCIMYDKDISKSVIVAMKYKGYSRVMHFCADEIVSNICASYDLDFSKCIIAYPKRARRAVMKYGFDHAKMLACLVSKKTGIPIYHGVYHRGGANQKTLDVKSRGKNAFANLYIDERGADIGALKDKIVIVIDDIITTGATGLCIAALAHNKGAKQVRIFSVGRTPKKKYGIL